MAKSNTKYTPPPPTELIVSRKDFIQKLEERIQKGEEILKFNVSTQSDFDNNRNDFNIWNDYNSEYLKQSFNNEYNEYKKRYDDCTMLIGLGKNRQGPQGKLLNFKESVKAKLSNLKKLLGKADLLKSSIEEPSAKEMKEASTKTNKIFIVHGHNDHIKIDVARTLEKLGLQPIILSEQPNQGQTIIEKFELHSDVGFAIVLLTADDLGRVKTSDKDKYRARQNVIIEMGYFIGKLGRSNVFPMYEDGVELPSDLHGILYNSIDDAKTWKFKLVKELTAAGYQVDANKIL
ncbi:nucleotide-binding protein [Maribacter arcticus]|uniref:nucleotide-binding protein n=1 Tax=Maribacter arcticus TaxID=561365 RepID=UPI0030022D3D